MVNDDGRNWNIRAYGSLGNVVSPPNVWTVGSKCTDDTRKHIARWNVFFAVTFIGGEA